jgi:hypothetical protein
VAIELVALVVALCSGCLTSTVLTHSKTTSARLIKEANKNNNKESHQPHTADVSVKLSINRQ